MLILLDFVVIFPPKIIRGNTGRRGSTRSGLLEHGNAEKTDLFSDARQRTAWRSYLFLPTSVQEGFFMKRITALVLMLIMSVLLITDGSAEKTEADEMAKGFDTSCFTENKDYFRTDVSEDGQTAFIQTLMTAGKRAFTTPYENDLYYSAVFPELMITGWNEEKKQTPFFRIWIRYRGTKQLNINAVSLIADGMDYRFLDVNTPGWTAVKDDGTAAQDIQLVLGSTPVNATCFAMLFSKAVEYTQAQMSEPETPKPDVAMVLVGDEKVKVDLPTDFWSELAAFAYNLESINGFSFLTSTAGTSCIIMK